MSKVHASWLLAVSAGCISSRYAWYERDEYDPVVRSIAIVEFHDGAVETGAGKLVAQYFLTELAEEQEIRTVDLTGVPEAHGVTIDRSRAEELGRHAEVHAVLTGRVLVFEYDRAPGNQHAKMPSVIMSARLVASRDGKILWMGSVDATRNAAVSADSMPLEEVAQSLVAELAEELVDALL